MCQLTVAALTLLCASSISILSPVPTRTALRPGAVSAPTSLPIQTLPSVSATSPSAPVALAPTAEFDPVVAQVLSHLTGRHTQLSRRDLIAVATTIVAEAKRHQLDPSLVLAVILVESGCYNLAVSHVGALGLMQLMPSTGEELARKHGIAWSGEESLFDPVVNIKLGTAYLKQLSDRYHGDVMLALSAYNWGPGRIDRLLRRGDPLPTEYTRRVFRSYSLIPGAS